MLFFYNNNKNTTLLTRPLNMPISGIKVVVCTTIFYYFC